MKGKISKSGRVIKSEDEKIQWNVNRISKGEENAQV